MIRHYFLLSLVKSCGEILFLASDAVWRNVVHISVLSVVFINDLVLNLDLAMAEVLADLWRAHAAGLLIVETVRLGDICGLESILNFSHFWVERQRQIRRDV